MPKVQQDIRGLYIKSSGSIARPTNETAFKVGDVVKAHQFQGSTSHSVRKEGCIKEFWSSLHELHCNVYEQVKLHFKTKAECDEFMKEHHAAMKQFNPRDQMWQYYYKLYKTIEAEWEARMRIKWEANRAKV